MASTGFYRDPQPNDWYIEYQAWEQPPVLGSMFLYQGATYYCNQIDRNESTRTTRVRATPVPSAPEYDDNEIINKNGEVMAVVRTEKPKLAQWKKGMLGAAEFNAQMGKGYSAMLADAARQRKAQIKMQQESQYAKFPSYKYTEGEAQAALTQKMLKATQERLLREMLKADSVANSTPSPKPAQKPAVKPKPDPFPTAKRIIKLKD